MPSKLIVLLLWLFASATALADIEDIDAGAPETMDDQIRKTVTPPQYADPPAPLPQGQGPYIYNGYPYPFVYPYGRGAIGDINPVVQPRGLRR